MKPVNEIYSDFLLGRVTFHKAIETNMFRAALMNHVDGKYGSSAILCAVLYEMVFTTRLIRETSNPEGFLPSKDNIQEQMENLMKREEEVINQQRLSFKNISKQLKELDILTEEEKAEYDEFYSKIRNPVAHGLTFRLFEPMLERPPNNTFEIDVNHDAIYKKASELLIDKIYHLMAVKELRKK